jgi:alkylation response protein AidB-like acyl-CoA dehydrogenase
MAAVLEPTPSQSPSQGGGFLLEEVGKSRINTPESFSEEQRLYSKTALQFCREQVLPRAVAIEARDNGLLRSLLHQAGELGLLGLDLPEVYGGLQAEKTTSMLVAEANGSNGSWSVTFSAHTGIGTLPIAWFGSVEQKKRWLPGLASGEKVAAYALTEQGSGSDALGAKTKAVKSADGKSWVLNGSKLYITNAAFADVFVVFAKVDGEKFTGFVVERGAPGFTVGPEEHKMGIRGSSTCPLFFEDAHIPVENVLGEIGKGHKIAFNILNLGRLKLGAAVVGGMKQQLENAVRFAAERKQFGTPVGKFPLLREKFARMAGAIYAVESMCYRTSGLIDTALAKEDRSAADYDAKTIAAIEEFAVEASILKVAGSEALGLVVDDAVQIHGGAGFIEDYPVERAYRDARVNRIFEGTNEINRMLVTGMLLKRAAKGALPLFAQAEAVERALSAKSGPAPVGRDGLSGAAHTTECLKWLALYALKAAVEAFGTEQEKHQEVLGAVSDIVIDAYAVDSMVTRTRQAGGLDPVRTAMTAAYAVEAHARGTDRARRALCACAEGPALEAHLARIAPLTQFRPYAPAKLRETVVQALEAAGGYPAAVA